MLPDRPNSPAPRAQPEVCVTYHAVTRYIQRILDITVEGKFPDQKSAAKAHCQAAGLTIAEVRKIIWTPGIALAVSMGVTQVNNGTFVAMIDPGQRIIATILRSHEKKLHRLKILSEREFSRRSKLNDRKQKRRPKPHGLQLIDEGA